MRAEHLALPGTEVKRFEDQSAVAAAAAAAVLAAAQAAIEQHGRFRLCLAGGTTPTAAYRLLANAQAAWDRWWIYHGDERCLPLEDGERNSLVADEAWLKRVPIPRSQVFAIPAELGAEAAARAYEPVVEAALPFDLVLLGIGEDGHTASLFPGRELTQEQLVIPVHEAPKPPPDRVSLTRRALTRTGRLLILVTGSGKGDAVRAWREGAALPIASVAAAAPHAEVFIDEAAVVAAAP
jgi:6-phosphogluconolactonase